MVAENSKIEENKAVLQNERRLLCYMWFRYALAGYSTTVLLYQCMILL